MASAPLVPNEAPPAYSAGLPAGAAGTDYKPPPQGAYPPAGAGGYPPAGAGGYPPGMYVEHGYLANIPITLYSTPIFYHASTDSLRLCFHF